MQPENIIWNKEEYSLVSEIDVKVTKLAIAPPAAEINSTRLNGWMPRIEYTWIIRRKFTNTIVIAPAMAAPNAPKVGIKTISRTNERMGCSV